jgi:hypothetical protein
MKLKTPKLVTKAHLPSVINLGRHVMSVVVDVKGAAIEASADDKDTPTCATFKA